jgi:competence protein ComEA
MVSLISFLFGVFFDHYILQKSFDLEQKPQEELEILLQEEEEGKKKDKLISKEEGCSIYVDVSGSLRNPGVYCLESNALIIDAVNKAGGFSKDAATKFISRKINLAQPLIDNQKLYFPFENELICQLEPLVEESKKIENMFVTPVTTLPTTEPYSDTDQNTTPSSSNSGTDSTNENNTQCVNINTATKEQLVTLNGVGEVTAEKIIQGRPYSKVEDLLNVSGIGEATLNKFKDQVCI